MEPKPPVIAGATRYCCNTTVSIASALAFEQMSSMKRFTLSRIFTLVPNFWTRNLIWRLQNFVVTDSITFGNRDVTDFNFILLFKFYKNAQLDFTGVSELKKQLQNKLSCKMQICIEKLIFS